MAGAAGDQPDQVRGLCRLSLQVALPHSLPRVRVRVSMFHISYLVLILVWLYFSIWFGLGLWLYGASWTDIANGCPGAHTSRSEYHRCRVVCREFADNPISGGPGHAETRLDVRGSGQTLRDLNVARESVFRVWVVPAGEPEWEAFSN